MQILTASQVSAWDNYTLEKEHITSLELMEKASLACFEWIRTQNIMDRAFAVFCGKGNNGGDGLALARMLSVTAAQVSVYILEFGHKGTPDFQANLERLHDYPVNISYISESSILPQIPATTIIIDALYGSGLNRPVDGLSASVVNSMNGSGSMIIALDLPSGLPAEGCLPDAAIVSAQHTLSFQCWKPSFLLAQNQQWIGQLHILSIGLHPGFLLDIHPKFRFFDAAYASGVLRQRASFVHKGNFGHALLIGGSMGKCGAMILCARACLRSGIGLLSLHIPGYAMPVVQQSVPEAMVLPNVSPEFLLPLNDAIPSSVNAVGIGPGMGTSPEQELFLDNFLEFCQLPLLLDADALNLLAKNPNWLKRLPAFTILTPHPKEFERLFGAAIHEGAQWDKAIEMAQQFQVIIVLKGHRTLIALPDGRAWVNSSGNAGMATGGMGDALTGIITGFLSQGYSPENAAVLGVYLHGLAGDHALAFQSMESLLPSDLIDYLGQAFSAIHNRN